MNNGINVKEAITLLYRNKMPMCLSNKRGQIEPGKYVVVDAFGFSNADEVKGKPSIDTRFINEQKTLVKIMTACKNGMSFTGNLINYTKRRSPVLNELQIDVINDDCFLVASTKVSDIMYNKMPMCLSNKRGQIECANTSWLDHLVFQMQMK